MSKVQLSPVKFGRSYYRSQYLKSDEWKVIREKTMRKADWKCERCAPDSNTRHPHASAMRIRFCHRVSSLMAFGLDAGQRSFCADESDTFSVPV